MLDASIQQLTKKLRFASPQDDLFTVLNDGSDSVKQCYTRDMRPIGKTIFIEHGEKDTVIHFE